MTAPIPMDLIDRLKAAPDRKTYVAQGPAYLFSLCREASLALSQAQGRIGELEEQIRVHSGPDRLGEKERHAGSEPSAAGDDHDAARELITFGGPSISPARDLAYAQSLAAAAAKHYGPPAGWKPQGDMYGVLMQIDNALTGLHRPHELQPILPLLASAWFYGGWKAESHTERQIQSLMEAAGWWPFTSETALLSAIADASERSEESSPPSSEREGSRAELEPLAHVAGATETDTAEGH